MTETLTESAQRADRSTTTISAYVYLIDKESGETGEFVGFGSLLNEFVVALHAEADLAPRTPLRCLIVGEHIGVVDGRAVNDGTPDGPVSGVELTESWSDPVPRVLPGRAVTSGAVRSAYAEWLARVAADDPELPPYPPPVGPLAPVDADPDGEHPPDPQKAEGTKPGYCMIFPHLPGCR